MDIGSAIKSKYSMLLAIAASAVGTGLYFVTNQGAETDDPAAVARVCNLPGNVPVAILDALAIPRPTQPDGTGTGRCLPPADAELGYRKLRILGAIADRWRAANLNTEQCALARVAIEFEPPGDADDHSDLYIQACGPAPTVAMTEDVERLERLPGTAVELLWTSAKYAKPSGAPVLRWWGHDTLPAAYQAALPCACCALGQECTVDGAPGRPATQYEATKVSGAGKRPMPCGIHQLVADRIGANGLVPSECL